MKNNLDSELSSLIGDGVTKVVGLGVIAFKGGKEVYSYFGGRRHINPDKKMTRQTLLRVASPSKIFVALSIMQLVEQGKISIADDVNDYLGFELRNPNFPDTPITIKMLASHTSSLRDGKFYMLPPQYSLKEFFRAGGVAYEGGAHFSAKKPSEYFHYCNLNYGILGTIIESVTGERFDLYQKNHIFKPLAIGGGYVVGNFTAEEFQNLGTLYLKNSAQMDDYKVLPRRDTVRLPDFYSDISLDCDLSDYQIGTNATIFAPQGGLRISFEDLGKCLQMLMNRGEYNGRQIICAESFNAMVSSHWQFDASNPNGDTLGGVMENYGLGTYKIVGKSRARLCKDFEIDLIGHSGEAFGIISGVYFVPNTHDGAIFMINGTAIEPDKDERALGKFSAGYIWEEEVMNPVCRYIFADFKLG